MNDSGWSPATYDHDANGQVVGARFGDPLRMQRSMNERTTKEGSEIKRCLYVNTDADAAKAGVDDPKKYGSMVENQLIDGYGAKPDETWFNQKLDGQLAMNTSTPAQQCAATVAAGQVQGTFDPCP